MKAEEYATKHAKGKDDIFPLFHAFEEGRIAGENKKFPSYIFLIIFLAMGFAWGLLIAKWYPEILKHI